MHRGALFYTKLRFGKHGLQLSRKCHRLFIQRKHFGERNIACFEPIDDGRKTLEFGFERCGWRFWFAWWHKRLTVAIYQIAPRQTYVQSNLNVILPSAKMRMPFFS